MQQGANKAAETTLGTCVEAYAARLVAGKTCAECGRAYAENGTKENREALAAATRARAQVHQALNEARLRLRAAVEAEFGAPLVIAEVPRPMREAKKC